MFEKNLLREGVENRQGDLKRAEELLQQGKPNKREEVIDGVMVATLKKAMCLFEKWGEKEKMAEGYEYLGNYQYEINQFKEAISFYEQSLALRLELYGEVHETLCVLYFKIGDVNNFLHNFNHAKTSLDKALTICNQLYESENELAAYIYFSLGVWHNYQHQYIPAINFFQLSLQNGESDSSYPIERIANTYQNIGYTYSKLTNYEKARHYLKKGIDLFQKNYPPNHSDFHYAFYNYANLFLNIGDYHRAELYAKKAIEIGEYHQSPHLLYSYGTLMKVYINHTKYDKAMQVGELLVSFSIENKLDKHGAIVFSYSELAKCYLKVGKQQEAYTLTNKCISLSQELFDKDRSKLAFSFQSMGIYHTEEGNYDQAESYFSKALGILDDSGDDTKVPKVSISKSLGKLYMKKHNYWAAIKCYHEVLIALIETDVRLDNYYAYPVLNSNATNFDNYLQSVDGVVMLLQKADSFFQYFLQNTQEQKDLQASFDGYKLAFSCLDYIRQSFQSDQSKLMALKHISPKLDKAIKPAYQLFMLTQDKTYLNRVFAFSEKNKAYLMLNSKQEKTAKQLTVLPTELLEKEQEMQSQLIMLQKNIQILKQQGQNINQQVLQQWENSYFDVFNQFESLKKQLETDYPDYYLQKYSTETVTIEALQSVLVENQTALSYFIREEKIYLFTITLDEYEVFAMDKPNNWESLIQKYLQSIKFDQKDTFHQLSFELYQILLQEATHHLIDPFEDEAKQVFIIPHAELHYLPFETLIISDAPASTPYNELDYLLNHCQISYHYSATLLYLDLQKQNDAIAEPAPTDIAFTGFAPVYETTSESQKQAIQQLQKEDYEYATAVNRSEAVRSDGSWMPLPYSKIEVENISLLFEEKGLNNQSFFYETANKKNLEAQIGKSRFVLIAAHGIVNDEYPELSGLVLALGETVDDGRLTVEGEQNLRVSEGLEERSLAQTAVEDSVLNMKEVAMIPMSADLVVLSSCESGIGELHKGEGMMAVNRGFLASGAKNVVSTLFKVNDRASSELTTLLFAHILEGDGFATALQKAKLEMLQKERMSPKFWSGFVLFGKGK
ncbi:MAG: CHAT domain-containing tetratricopeptide repeat protein [Chitinophagales bacterium]